MSGPGSEPAAEPGPDGEQEPDYRMSLAAERTYLAYVRTSLAMIAGGVAVVGALTNAGHEGLRRATGVVLIAVGTLIAVTARMRWRAVDTAMRRGQPLPHNRTTLPIEVGVLVAAVLALLLVLVV